MALTAREKAFNSLIDDIMSSEKRRRYTQTIQLCDKMTAQYADLVDLDLELLLKGVRGRALTGLRRYAEAKRILGEVLEYNITHGLPVASSTYMYRWLCAHFEGDEDKALAANRKLNDEKAVELLREAGMPAASTLSSPVSQSGQQAVVPSDGKAAVAGVKSLDAQLEELKRFVETLDKGGVPPFDNEQRVIDEIGDARQSNAVPLLHRALISANEYHRRAKAEFSRTDPDTIRAGQLHIMITAVEHMQSRLQNALSMCAPPKKWWQFWK